MRASSATGDTARSGFRDWLASNGLTLAQVGRRSGVSTTYLKWWLSGQSKVLAAEHQQRIILTFGSAAASALGWHPAVEKAEADELLAVWHLLGAADRVKAFAMLRALASAQ